MGYSSYTHQERISALSGNLRRLREQLEEIGRSEGGGGGSLEWVSLPYRLLGDTEYCLELKQFLQEGLDMKVHYISSMDYEWCSLPTNSRDRIVRNTSHPPEPQYHTTDYRVIPGCFKLLYKKL